MLDFAMLPPEVSSAQMYSGPGPGPLMAAAAAWDSLAGQLNSFSLGYSSVLSELQDEIWSGTAAQTMAAAAAPYIAWVASTATATEQAANQARAAAAAFETAFAATVPPAVVTANRTHLATLIATNLFGQNTAAIATVEAAYAQMWAQDAAAMYGYATAASTATQLTPFAEPPRTTNDAAHSPQAAAAQAVGSTAAQHLNAPPSVQPVIPPSLADQTISGVGNFNTLSGPASLAAQMSRTVTNAGSFFTALAKAVSGTAAKLPAALPAIGAAATAGSGATVAQHAVLARVAESAPLGRLSVPRTWADATPVAAATEEPLWLSDEEPAAASSGEGSAGPGMLGAAPAAAMGAATGTLGRSTVNTILRVGPRRFSMPRPSVGG